MTNTEKWIQAHRKEILDAITQSVRIPSVKGKSVEGMPFGEGPAHALQHALHVAEELGFRTTNLDNYIGYAEIGQGNETLGVLTHLDVMPISENWKHQPFDVTEENGILYGRGIVDDKGPAIGSLFALKAVSESTACFKRKVRILFGCDEESGWGCMKYYQTHERMPDLAFSPDSEYPLVNSEKGICQLRFSSAFKSNIRIHAGIAVNAVPDLAEAEVPLSAEDVQKYLQKMPLGSKYPVSVEEIGSGCKITVHGTSAHASIPQEGRNALLALIVLLRTLPLGDADANHVAVINALFGQDCFGEHCGLEMQDNGSRLTINVSVMKWTEHGIEEFALDCRCPATKDVHAVKLHLSTLMAEHGFNCIDENVMESHYVAPESELVSTLLDVYQERFGDRPAPLAVGGGTYARTMEKAVGFGIMRKDHAYHIHADDECVPMEDLFEDIGIIAEAIKRLAT